ncbi:MAG: hypothetical protein JNK11_14370 [Alphaproteobacteria bacterium]|nr:hypothetical protein [Alphaproteobacteria bacterium]
MTDRKGTPGDDSDAAIRALWARSGKPRPVAGSLTAEEHALLAAWIEGALPEAEAGLIEAKLAADPGLLDVALGLRAARPAPASVGPRLRRRLDAALTLTPTAAGGRAMPRPAEWLGRAAAALLIMSASVGATVGSYMLGAETSRAAVAAMVEDPLGLNRLLEPAGFVREDDT